MVQIEEHVSFYVALDTCLILAVGKFHLTHSGSEVL